jgi:hypothetical protein
MCSDLAGAMTQTLGVGAETADVPIEHSWSEQTGSGCQVTATGNGLNFDSVMVVQDMMRAILQNRGWVQATQAPTCLGHGGWGPGATTSCFIQADKICEAFVYVAPADASLCTGDEPITVCLSELTPEQRIYNSVLTCAQGYEAMPASGGLQPLSPDQCANIAGAMGQNLGLSGETTPAPFTDHVTQQTGTGCQVTFTTNGLVFEHIGVIEGPARAALENLGWQEDPPYAGGGPGGAVYGFRKDNGLCRLVIGSGPSDAELCSDDEPIGVCWERLTPEQRTFTVNVNCVQGDFAALVPPARSEPLRIEFAPGTASTQVHDALVADELHPYVLTAMAGQTLIVNLYVTTGGVQTPGSAILVIWGADGTVLISDHADATFWSGDLPLSQDYYIDVLSRSQDTVDYTLDVYIPPQTEPPADATGAISGIITPAGQHAPPLHVVAYKLLESNVWYWVSTAENQRTFTLSGLAPGTYNIVAYSESGQVGGYVKAGVLELVPITLDSGDTITDVDINAWFEPAAAPFPPDPTQW